MKTADAHCDTLTAHEKPFTSPEASWNIDKFSSVNGSLQYMDICAEPDLAGDSALRFAVRHLGRFWQHKTNKINLLEKSSDFKEEKINVVLALEGASPVIDEMCNLYAYFRLGIRSIILTWNHRNYIGEGVDGKYGLTDFGKDFVREMEKLNMLVDVSHLNQAGFDDVVKTAQKSFMASHSNAYSVYPHKRNLNDDQIKEIISRGGFLGINFYSVFIADSDDKDYLTNKFLEHIEHFLKLGAEDCLGFGSDWDGMDQSPFDDARDYIKIGKLLKDRLSLTDDVIQKIMHENLINYTLKMLPQ